jgi:uncharacterized SAM-binding protein YcdF (DUF218 family)
MERLPKDRPQGKGFPLALRILALAAVAYAIGFVVFAATLPDKPVRVDGADGIVALTGGGARLDAAVALFERGVGKRLLISGVHATTTKSDLKRIAHGGPRFDCCTDLGFQAENTRGNATEAARWARAHHYHRLVIVTASYHMPRSLTEFSAEMPDVTLEPYPVEPDGIDFKAWWRDPRAAELLQAEYAKYLASLVLTRFDHAGRGDALDRSAARGNSGHES